MDDGANASPLRGVAFSPVMPDILRGATAATALGDLSELQLAVPPKSSPGLAESLSRLYGGGGADPVVRAGRETLAVLETLRKLDPKHYAPENHALYPQSRLGEGLKETALLIKAGVGLEVAALDRGGWDTHVAQGGSLGYLALQLEDVAKSLSAFAADLGPHFERVTCVVMTEFGRRVAENSGLGTDHGRASAWLVMGGHLPKSGGGKVHARWPTLAPGKLEGPGDLPVTTDYRDVLTEILTKRIGMDGKSIFPGAPGNWPGVV